MKITNHTAKNENSGNNDAVHDKNGNSQRLALSSCKAILHEGSILYTDEEILAIRDFLYQCAGYATEQHLLEQEGPNNVSNQLNNVKHEKSVFVYPQLPTATGRKKRWQVQSGKKAAAILPVATP